MQYNNGYWNPLLETLPREKLKQLQLKKFKEVFRWAYDKSPFYHRFYGDAGIEPGDIRTFEDIKKVPKISKELFRDIQGKDPFPYGDILCVPLKDVVTYHQTSGTSGQPVYQAANLQDWENDTESYAYALYAQGYRDDDRLFLPFGYNVFLAFWGAHLAAEKIGCEVIPGGALNTEVRILKMKNLKATAMAATPTYVLGMAETAQKMGIDLSRDLCIRRITVAGEPGGSVSATRNRMEEQWGAKVYDQAGCTEAGHWGWECSYQSGLHVNEAFFLVEIEDIETGENIETPGVRGKMVVTSLTRFAQPCIRFDVKDLVEWSPYDCDCGRTFRLLNGGIKGRFDDITKVKGVLFSPGAVEEVLRKIPKLGNEYQVIVVKKGSIDDITLKVEVLPDYQNDFKDIKDTLDNELRMITNLRFNLEFPKIGTLPRSETKARRFIDLREHKEKNT